ncbi:MAG: class I SAM-dependent methyltransferase [bacterium]|nr:class I SAM-dependent methyltransferase [bacterium]
MAFLEKILGKIIQKLWPEKIPEFAAEMYIQLAKGAKTQFYKAVAKEIIERVESRRNVWNLLDVGTGPGFMLFEIADLADDLELVGIDLSEKLINFAKGESEKRSYGDIHFEIGDANHLDFKDNVCDFIISSGVLHSLKNPSAAIREWLRVLRPGHDLWIYDPTVLNTEEEAKNPEHLKKIFEDMGKTLASKKDRFIFRFMRAISDFSNLPPHPMSLADIKKIIFVAGLENLASCVYIENRRNYLKIEIVKK